MALPKFGLNLSNLGNIPPPNITLPTSGEDAISMIPQKAGELVGFSVLAHGLIGGLALLLFWILSDKLPMAEFKYSDLRAMFLSTAIASVMGVVMVEIGYLASFKALSFYIILSIVFYIFLISSENKK